MYSLYELKMDDFAMAQYDNWHPFAEVSWIFLFPGKTEECKAFFETLYKFVYVLGTYLKPHVSSFFLYAFYLKDL